MRLVNFELATSSLMSSSFILDSIKCVIFYLICESSIVCHYFMFIAISRSFLSCPMADSALWSNSITFAILCLLFGLFTLNVPLRTNCLKIFKFDFLLFFNKIFCLSYNLPIFSVTIRSVILDQNQLVITT